MLNSIIRITVLACVILIIFTGCWRDQKDSRTVSVLPLFPPDQKEYLIGNNSRDKIIEILDNLTNEIQVNDTVFGGEYIITVTNNSENSDFILYSKRIHLVTLNPDGSESSLWFSIDDAQYKSIKDLISKE